MAEDTTRQLDSITRRLVALQAEQDKQHKTLYGNGEPGWDEMLRDMSKRLAKLEDDLQEKRNADKDVRLLGMKVSADLRMTIINGTFIMAGIVVTWWLNQ
jgi:hypothetical protein